MFKFYDDMYFGGSASGGIDQSRVGRINKGLFDIVSLGPWEFFPGGVVQDEPDYAHMDTAAIPKIKDAVTPLCMLNIEHWPLGSMGAPLSDELAKESVEKYKKVSRYLRLACPDVQIGWYANLPVREYWASVSNDRTNMALWQSYNDRLMHWGMADEVDVIFPSLYTFYDDEAGWHNYARANILEARRYGKPVIPYIWPLYHNSNQTLGGQFIPGAYWKEQLETVSRHADGAVIWFWSSTHIWDENAPWWTETKTFLAGL